MHTIDMISVVVSAAVVGGLILRGGLLANTMLIAEVVWTRRWPAPATAQAEKHRELQRRPLVAR